MNYTTSCAHYQFAFDLESAAPKHLAATRQFPAVSVDPLQAIPRSERPPTDTDDGADPDGKTADGKADEGLGNIDPVAVEAAPAQNDSVRTLLMGRPRMEGRVSVIGGQTLIEADCIPLLRSLPDQSVDILIAGPTCKGSYHTTGPRKGQMREEFAAFMGDMLTSAARVLKTSTGSLFLSLKGGASERLLYAETILTAERCGLRLQNEFVIVTSIAIDGVTRGQYTPLNGDAYPNNTNERVLHLTPTGRTPLRRAIPGVGVPYADKANLARFGHDEDLHCAGITLFMPPKTIAGPKVPRGPAPFSPDLVRHLLLIGGAGPESVVIDPVVGGGTTLEVARELGMSAIGIEIDPAIAAMARDRLAAIK